MRKFLLAGALMVATLTPALAQDPILGKWRAPGGGIVEVSSCGPEYCARVVSGRHTGKDAGSMSGEAGSYSGTVTDPRDDRSYSGSAAIEGDRLKLTGCALKVFCKTQVWVRA